MTRQFLPTIPEIGSGASLNAIVARSSSKRSSTIAVTGAGLAPFLAQLSSQRHEQMLVLVEDLARARLLFQDLTFHLEQSGKGTGDEVLFFPDFDLGPYDELAPDRRLAMQRTSALFKLAYGINWRFIVVPAEALLRKIISRASFEEICTPIVVGERLDREGLVRFFERGGYHRTPLVEEPGTYAIRGSLLDLFPPYLDRPVRVDMFGSEVEKIRFYDPDTQRSEEETDEIWVHPVLQALVPKQKQQREETSKKIREICDAVDLPMSRTAQLIEDVLGDRLIVGKEGYCPAYGQVDSTLLDYLPSKIGVCVEDMDMVRVAWQKYGASLQATYERRIESGSPAFPPDGHIVSQDVAIKRLVEYPHVFTSPLNISDVGEEEHKPVLDNIATANLGERIRNVSSDAHADLVAPFSQYLRKLESTGYRTTLVTHTDGQKQRLTSMLRSRGLRIEPLKEKPGIEVVSGELARGCILPGDGRCWITEEEVFGKRTRRRASSRRKPVSLDDLRMLSPGDLVVHMEHGIGRYEGLVRQQVRTVQMDFLLIVYRAGDKLYLPVHRLNQVQKYKGAEGRENLDKLGGQTFSKAKATVRRAAQEMAAGLLRLYAMRASAHRAPLMSPEDLYQSFEAAFPFEETDDQARAIDEMMADMDGPTPMDRLVCGDVGFGKTEVAMRAAFRAVMAGRQVAVLVPTTVLAQQHYQSFKARFDAYPVRVEVLSRFRTSTQNRNTVLALKDGKGDIVIGTHRLLSKDVHFKQLGLLIIDEEHRFGVTHKERIRTLKTSIDTLVLTATPIPRTLQMSFAGVRDLSLIATAPAARRPIQTMICHDDPKVLREAIERELAREGQVFYVHNRVRDISKVANRIQRMVPDAKVVIGHGQMKDDQLERVMLDFVAGRYDILVSTTIIESGIDIPRANTMIIDRADTFGMAQLYQLRGRVGRSHQQAYAYLVVPPLAGLSEEAKERVETLARYTELGSGFSVATMDMEIRGAGNLLGAEQSGSVSSVGFDMFCDLLSEAVAELQGDEPTTEFEPELTFESPGFIPEDYLPEVGQRLQYYKRLASAPSEREVEMVAAEMVDRFGPIVENLEELINTMIVKALCRTFRIRGLEAYSKSLVIHLATDTKVDPDMVINIVRDARGAVQLTSDLKVKVRYDSGQQGGAQGAISFLHQLGAYDNNSSIS